MGWYDIQIIIKTIIFESGTYIRGVLAKEKIDNLGR
jgi:hypothetical protein